MIVAGLQLDIEWESPEESMRRAEALAERAVAAGARLLVLPEMFATGFSMRSEAMASHAGAVRDFLASLASRHRLWVLGGYAEAGRQRPRNACSLMSPAGEEAAHYQKIHPFSLADEQEHYEGGEAMATVEVEGVRVTPLICYDLRFPELFRAAAEDTDLYPVIANWPQRRGHAWRTLLMARAMDGQAYVLGVNRVGEAQGRRHRGDSALVDPMGVVVASAAERPAVVLGEVDPGEVRRVRERYGFLADRRPEVYARLEGE
jgi:predicted amidohydrolase